MTGKFEKPEIVEVSSGKPAPQDEVAGKKAIEAALRRLRTIAHGKPIGTADEFNAARRAAAAEE